jgi:hypothetical protein
MKRRYYKPGYLVGGLQHRGSAFRRSAGRSNLRSMRLQRRSSGMHVVNRILDMGPRFARAIRKHPRLAGFRRG